MIRSSTPYGVIVYKVNIIENDSTAIHQQAATHARCTTRTLHPIGSAGHALCKGEMRDVNASLVYG